jgi:FtsP/CotA-like multicopper oxidase with cupredoxin domain
MKKDKIKKKFEMKMSRRQVLKAGLYGGATMLLPWRFLPAKAFAAPAVPGLGLSDPALQSLFNEMAPNALDPGFKFQPQGAGQRYLLNIAPSTTATGLNGGVTTPIFGYGQGNVNTWPGKTLEVQSDRPITVEWQNKLINGQNPVSHLLPVDTSLHWCYSLQNYTQYSIQNDGVPIITHIHGGHTLAKYDGLPERFYGPNYGVRGPRWQGRTYVYNNDQPAGTVWYHDHALGITRLNVYAGMAGFYIIRDNFDTGLPGNPLNLPAYPYEAAFAIQDRMFKATGELFYPAFPGDPAYADFITGEGVTLGPPQFPENPNNVQGFNGGGPTALAEFFGDHMVVNGKIWPKFEVEPRNYRIRLLNGCDSRFLVIQFFEVSPIAMDFNGGNGPLDFTVIGSDQGLASSPTTGVQTLVIEPGSRYDIIIDFKQVAFGNRVIMRNIGGDEPFGGTFTTEDSDLQIFERTDRIMAFDVNKTLDNAVPDVSPTGISFGPVVGTPNRFRKVALFEGKDEFGRLQPLLGTAEPATDFLGNPIYWPNEEPYITEGLAGQQMEGAIAWHSPTTENPALNSTEEWEIWNATGDAHPVHLHLVHFEIIGRQEIMWDSATDSENRVLGSGDTPNDDGAYLIEQPVVQHNGEVGIGFKIIFPTNPNNAYGPPVTLDKDDGYVENAPKDMVTALPDQITRIKAKFDRPGRYVWHCHILSHEDHEMMRVLHVGGGA